MSDSDANGEAGRQTLPAAVLAVELVVAAVIAAWALVDIWTLAHPSGASAVCPLVHPAPPGCWPQARFTPAFISAVVISLSYSAVTFLLLTVARHRIVAAVWALGGLAILAVLAGQYVTWRGLPG